MIQKINHHSGLTKDLHTQKSPTVPIQCQGDAHCSFRFYCAMHYFIQPCQFTKFISKIRLLFSPNFLTPQLYYLIPETEVSYERRRFYTINERKTKSWQHRCKKYVKRDKIVLRKGQGSIICWVAVLLLRCSWWLLQCTICRSEILGEAGVKFHGNASTSKASLRKWCSRS